MLLVVLAGFVQFGFADGSVTCKAGLFFFFCNLRGAQSKGAEEQSHCPQNAKESQQFVHIQTSVR